MWIYYDLFFIKTTTTSCLCSDISQNLRDMMRHNFFTLLSLCIIGCTLIRLGTFANTSHHKSFSISDHPNIAHDHPATTSIPTLKRSTVLPARDELSASQKAFRKCMQHRNGSKPVSHEEMVAMFARDQDTLPVDMRSTKWIDYICPGIRFDIGRQSTFERVYSSAAWTHGDSNVPLSGSGSTVEGTSSTRTAIARVISEYKIQSIIDVPCGDLTWMPELFPFFKQNNVTYTGMDIVPSLIEKHRLKFPHLKFQQLDYAKKEIPIEAELIFNREALQHINFYDVFLALHHFSLLHKGKYLLTTSYESNENNNLNWVDGATNTIIQLDKSPYFLKPEAIYEDGRPGGINRLKLFKLPIIRIPPKQN